MSAPGTWLMTFSATLRTKRSSWAVSVTSALPSKVADKLTTGSELLCSSVSAGRLLDKLVAYKNKETRRQVEGDQSVGHGVQVASTEHNARGAPNRRVRRSDFQGRKPAAHPWHQS